MCGILRSFSVVIGARQSLCSSAARLARPLDLGIQSGRQYTFGLLLRLGMMAGAEGQEATHASSSHWVSRLLQGHLYRRPDWKSRAWRRRHRRRGGKRRDFLEGDGNERLDNREVFTFCKVPAFWENTPLFSVVASFQLSKNTVRNLGHGCNTLRHTKQCQDRRAKNMWGSTFLERSPKIDEVQKL